MTEYPLLPPICFAQPFSFFIFLHSYRTSPPLFLPYPEPLYPAGYQPLPHLRLPSPLCSTHNPSSTVLSALATDLGSPSPPTVVGSPSILHRPASSSTADGHLHSAPPAATLPSTNRRRLLTQTSATHLSRLSIALNSGATFNRHLLPSPPRGLLSAHLHRHCHHQSSPSPLPSSHPPPAHLHPIEPAGRDPPPPLGQHPPNASATAATLSLAHYRQHSSSIAPHLTFTKAPPYSPTSSRRAPDPGRRRPPQTSSHPTPRSGTLLEASLPTVLGLHPEHNRQPTSPC